eukprot:CAMPEP_0176124474 /NCGR_PEP_ID=MMETSP0120_2-20121206/62760_1 /TAXON_ID=160619 /ORGANISM="Kryptoperidinium foliaceum, Strain CCMP 1326" /LENGTH=84 /DNA_ID=CAMNT_0017459253 /DNA_START=26 /DNA_END=276 /DNA_ORIENTATION=-
MKELQFRPATEEVMDMSDVLQQAKHDFTTGKYRERGGDFDADVLLCTIPAFACSVFADLPLPLIMYAANPATAQVPFTMQATWL